MSISVAPGDDGPTFGVSLRLNRREAQMAGNERGRVRVEQGAKRVRAYLGGELVADTTRPLLVWEGPTYPTYYFPTADVRSELLHADGAVSHSPARGDGESLTVPTATKEARGAAVRYEAPPLEQV